MKNKTVKFFTLTLLIILIFNCFSGCFGFAKQNSNEKKLAKIERFGDYAFFGGILMTYNGKSFSLEDLAEEQAIKDGFLRSDTYLGSSLFDSYVFENDVYFILLVDYFGHYTEENSSYDYFCGKWTVSNPNDITVLEYVTGAKNTFRWEGVVNGEYFLEKRDEFDNCVVLCKISDWQKTFIEKPENYSANIVNEMLYFYNPNKDVEVCDYVFFDENLQKYHCGELPNEKIIYINQSYALFQNGTWLNYKTSEFVVSEQELYELSAIYMRYSQEKAINSSRNQFFYKNTLYNWKNEFAPRTEDDRPDFHTASELVISGPNSEYRLKYSAFENMFPQIFEIYPSLYVLDVIVQNNELYIVYGYDSGGALSILGSNEIVFKYDEQTKNLVYIGYANYLTSGISNVIKAK